MHSTSSSNGSSIAASIVISPVSLAERARRNFSKVRFCISWLSGFSALNCSNLRTSEYTPLPSVFTCMPTLSAKLLVLFLR